MNELRHERERRGWSLDDIARRTRIPMRYLEALEDGDTEVLPPGPFFRGYLRQYLEFLGQEEQEERTEDEQAALDECIDFQVADAIDTAHRVRQEVPLLRLILAGFVITLALVLAMQVGGRLNTTPLGPDGAPLPLGPPHDVSLYAVEDVRVSVIEDGQASFSGMLSGTQTMEFNATRRLEVDIGDLTRVRVHYNGERIEPLGNLSRGRKLVFVHTLEE